MTPVDFTEMLTHIADARALPPPNDIQVAEMKRALRGFEPDTIRAGVKNFLATDAKAVGRLPYPPELVGYVQSEARRIKAGEVTVETEEYLAREANLERVRQLKAERQGANQ